MTKMGMLYQRNLLNYDDDKICIKNFMTEQELRKEIGKQLFNKLSEKDKKFMMETAGSFGYRNEKIDLEEVERQINESKN